MASPPVREPAPRKTPRTLALLPDRLSGRPSFSLAPTIGASLFGPPHPSSDHCFPRAVIAPQPPLETVDSPSNYRFSTCDYTSRIVEHLHCRANTATRAPFSPELRGHLRFTTRAPPSPEFHLSPELRRPLSFAIIAPYSPELRRHLSFATRAPPSPEFHLSLELRRHPSFTTRHPLFLRSIFDRASSSPALRDQNSSGTEIRRHLSSPELCDQGSTFVRAPPFHLSSSSVFRDYFIRCLSPSRHCQRQGNVFSGHYHRPRRRRHHLLRPSGNYFSDFCSHAPMGLPLQTATSGEAPSSWPLPPTPASSHRQRRPAGTYFADSCSHRAGRSTPSVRY